jgi:hypothetical protein
MSRISESLFAVSSNPGVSTRTTSFPSRRKGDVCSIRSVQDVKLSPMRKFDPLARLINYSVLSVPYKDNTSKFELTVDFPTPVGPMTLHGCQVRQTP